MKMFAIFWIFAAVLSLARAQTKVDSYSALVPVNIRCTNDPIKGLSCAALYPQHCKEQWNFPNPCTPQHLAQNKTKFEHPFDKTKFLMCGDMGKLYVVQCPQYEAYFTKCGQCVGEQAGLTASCETPLIETVHVANPCTRAAILANKLFFPFPGNLNKFIHCDIWGKAWERICTAGEVWSQWAVSCVNPNLLNPCNRPNADVKYLYTHPCNPIRYLNCGVDGNAFEMDCGPGFVFSERNQRCERYDPSSGVRIANTCGTYQFGFRLHSSVGQSGSAAVSSGHIGSIVSGGVQGSSVINGEQGGSVMNGGQGGSSLVKSWVNDGKAGSLVRTLMSGGQGGSSVNGGQSGSLVNGRQVGSLLNGRQTVSTGNGGNSGSLLNGGQAEVIYVQTNQNLGNMKASAGTQGTAVIGNPTGGAPGTTEVLNTLLKQWQNNVSSRGAGSGTEAISGVSTGAGLSPSKLVDMGMKAGAQLVDTSMKMKVIPAALRKAYRNSTVPFTEPCTSENVNKGWRHFRLFGDPHSFIQCDMAGNMYVMPCSTNKRDFFDIYTLTCVDGPVHVDNQIPQ